MLMQLPDALRIPQWTEGIHFFFFKKRKITAFTLSEVPTDKYCWLSDDLGPLSYFEV